MRSYYKCCFVPQCRNTTISMPEMKYIAVPRNKERRIKWFTAVHKPLANVENININTSLYCCTEHFNLEEDMDNYIKYKLTGCRLKPKLEVVPHIFKSQKLELEDKTYPQPLKKSKISFEEVSDIDELTENYDIKPNFNEDLQSSEIKSTFFNNMIDTTFDNNISNVSHTDITCLLTPQVQIISNQCSIEFENISSPPAETYSKLKTIRSHTINLIKRQPKRYLGVPLLEDLNQLNVCIDEVKLLMTLMKIKLNDSFHRLGDQFELDGITCSKYFKQVIPVLSQHFSSLILFNEEINTFGNDVTSIIDFFEVQIEKPTQPVFKKFLVSCSPNGLINFISSSYASVMSDTEIVIESGFLDKLPRGSVVIADSRFKQIETELQHKNCCLIKAECFNEEIETKKIIPLIERVVDRFEEFAILKPHAMHESLSNVLDDIVIIAAGLINLQPEVF